MTSWFKQAKQSLSTKMGCVTFVMCMHGGSRPKSTSLWYGTALSLASLQSKCNGKHSHLPWSLRGTASERRYPELLCSRIAKLAKKRLLPVGQIEEKRPCSDKVFISTQPRRGMQELIPEHKAVHELRNCTVAEVDEAEKSI